MTVAVADTGIEVEHPDLRHSFYADPPIVRQGRRPFNPARDPLGHNFIADDEVKDDAYNILPRSRNGLTNLSHGTHVAGIIAAKDDAFGVVGIAPSAKILPMRILAEGRLPRRYMNDVNPGDQSLIAYDRQWGSMISFLRLDWGNQQQAFRKSFEPVSGYKIPFVMNNSWGFTWRPRIVEIDLPGNRKGYFLQPRVVKQGYHEFTSKLFFGGSKEQMRLLRENEKFAPVIVFAAGNDGWNSETGEIPVFDRRLSGEQIHDYLNPDVIKPIGYLDSDSPQIARTETPSNLPGPLSAAFVGNRELEGWWLAVVAVDKNNRIASFSNGCGEAARFCLAAPGVNILSTVSPRDRDYDNHYYWTESGTSMAAPVLSGALAVLKSRHPQLNARQAVDILLRTATDLGAPGTDPVYGHGLVNLERALLPIGPQNAAGGSGRAVAPTGTTRIAFSSAFGNAAPSATHLFGGLDSYGRVYRYRAPLQDRVLPGPRLSGVLALNNPRPAMMIGRTSGTATYLRSSADPHSAIGDGSALSVIGRKTRVDLAVARSRTSSLLSPAALLADAAEDRDRDTAAAPHDWGALAPQSRDLVSGGAGWQLAPSLATGAYFSRALAEGATRRGEAYGMTDLGVSARIGNGESGIGLHLGRLSEEGRFLGSKPEGGFALAGPTRSGYLRLSASRRLSNRLSVGVNVMKLRSRVDFRHDDFVADTDITARSAGAHLALRDAGRKGDRLVLHYGEPLAVTGGAIRQNSVMGYAADGAYRPAQSSLDLGVRSRYRMTQVMYRAPLADGISGFAAAAHHRNWSHQRGLGNNLVMFGLSLRR